MPAPNIAKVKQILSKNSTVVAGTTATTVVTNASNSYKVLKINQIVAGNNSSVFAKLTIDIYRGSTASRFLPGIQIPPVSILEAISKPIYLEEGDSLRVTCDVANAVEVSVSYEEMDSGVPKVPTAVEALVVGGGGGGGSYSNDSRGGGGGGGGFIQNLSFTPSYSSSFLLSIAVGAGGAAATNGSDSVFDTLTAVGGGGGGTSGAVGKTGGSGGGGGASGGTATFAGGAGTANQGYTGGAGGSDGSTYRAGGGGGGAGMVGYPASNATTRGRGGDGLPSSITGTATYYAGGGGGGFTSAVVGGLGGGGTGGQLGVSTNGIANTGGGGGGTGFTSGSGAGKSGGSGIVVVAYQTSFDAIKTVTGTLAYTLDTTSRPGYYVYKFTAGTGTISW